MRWGVEVAQDALHPPLGARGRGKAHPPLGARCRGKARWEWRVLRMRWAADAQGTTFRLCRAAIMWRSKGRTGGRIPRGVHMMLSTSRTTTASPDPDAFSPRALPGSPPADSNLFSPCSLPGSPSAASDAFCPCSLPGSPSAAACGCSAGFCEAASSRACSSWLLRWKWKGACRAASTRASACRAVQERFNTECGRWAEAEDEGEVP